MMLKFTEKIANEPKLTQKQICNQLGLSDSTIEGYKDDINMNSPYKRKNIKTKTLNQILQ